MSESRFWDYHLDTGEMTPVPAADGPTLGQYSFDLVEYFTRLLFNSNAQTIVVNNIQELTGFTEVEMGGNVVLLGISEAIANTSGTGTLVLAQQQRLAWLQHPYWVGVVGIAALIATAPKPETFPEVRFDWLGHPNWAGISGVTSIIALALTYLAYRHSIGNNTDSRDGS